MSILAQAKRERAWFKPFARLGYAARGLVYTVIGIFAVFASMGRGESMGSRDALDKLLNSDHGGIVTTLLIAGMLSYALWRLIQSLLDTDRHGFGARGLAVRAGLLGSAASYAVLAFYTLGLWTGSGSAAGAGNGGGDGLAPTIAGFIGSRPAAWTLAVIFAGVGFAHVAKAVKKGYARHFRASAETMKVIHPVARAGLTARGMVFVLLAFLFVYRGLTAGEENGGTPGVEAVLAFLQELPGGALLIGAMGAGLVCFAIYSFFESFWRHINVEDANAGG